MYIIIIGAGRIGSHLARILIEENHDVVVVDKNGDVCRDIASELECTTIRGDGSKPKVLEEAGIKEADVVVALTGSDETNLVISLMAKQLGAKHVAARLAALHYEEDVLKKLGLDLVIYPEAAAAGYIAEVITKPEVLDLAFIGRGPAEIVEVNVKKNSEIIGKKVKDIEHPQGTAIIAIYKDNEIILPDPETRINEKDKVLILAKKEKIKQVKKILGL